MPTTTPAGRPPMSIGYAAALAPLGLPAEWGEYDCGSDWEPLPAGEGPARDGEPPA